MNPAVNVGTVVTYTCPSGQVLSHDWFREPKVRMVCGDDGKFSGIEGDNWPKCISRE